MPLGPFGEVVGTTGTLEALSEDAQNYNTKVVAPRNPKLLRANEVVHKMTPSKFLFDMKLSTEQKLANTHIMRLPRKVELLDMGDTSLQKFSQVNIDEPLCQPFPSEVYFQNFEPFETYRVPLVLRNNDKVPRLVKVTQADSPYFNIISPNNVGHKVGPGLPTTFYIEFMPDEKKDYEHELIGITEREKFVIPVHAIGARAILDFPDDIHFPACAVKYPNSRTLLIRNIGNREAKFTVQTEKNDKDHKPFTVTPEIGTLPVNESMQVTVEFNPAQTGDHHSNLVISYDTGETVYVSLYGAAHDANVRLDKNSLFMESTYLSMATQRTITISNRSDVIAHFRWTQFATQEEEDQQKLLQQIELDREENTDTDRFLDECVQDPTLRDKLAILGRTFQNRKRVVDRDPMLFEDDVIKIEPVEGDIWPNSSFEVSVIFKPREAIQYTRTAFCDITGRQSRLPLRIRGEGAGPKVEFSCTELDMGNIFIGSKHTYEIVMANKGDIDAIYSVLPNSSIFGPCFSFNPAEGIVMPGGHQAIQVAFASPYLGDFSVEFFFQVDGSPERLVVTFKGSVIGPTFQFDVPMLKFGTVSYGFKHTQTCTLMNTSLVPMSFHLRVPGDGTSPSICATSDLEPDTPRTASTPRHGLPGFVAKEFEILPSMGTIPPQSEMKVKVTLTSNQTRKYENVLVVDVDHVGEEILSLAITARCVIPPISVLSPVLDYGRCFLRFPYQRCVKLHNDTDLPAKYIILPQEELNIDNPPILYESPEPKGVVAAHSVCEVPLEIRSQYLEEQEIPCFIAIFGSTDPPLHVHVACIGEGPVVHMCPEKLDWATIPVLVDSPQTIVLSNESLIPAKFTAHMVRPNSAFRVEPEEGAIPPESSLKLTVTAHLDDCVRFQDKLQLNFLESQSRLVPLLAYGQGTTVISDPPLLAVMDLGPNFSNRPLQKTFKLTNSGRRHQQLMWSTDGFSSILARNQQHNNVSASASRDMKIKSKPLPPEPARPIFSVSPSRFELKPGETIDFTLEGFVTQPKFVSERLLCHAILGRQGGKELIMKIDVSTEFISPLLEFSTKSVFFRVDKTAKDELKVQTRSLEISNVSSLPLTVSLALKHPFKILMLNGKKVEGMEIKLAFKEKHLLTIQFDPAYKDDLHIRTIDEVLHVTYKEHPHIDYIALRGEVYFPNLEFEKTTLSFGCILNDTEVTRYVNITNNSPMQVKYRWSFLVGNAPTHVKRIVRPYVPQLDNDLLGRVEEEEEEEGAGLEREAEVMEEEEDNCLVEEQWVEREQLTKPKPSIIKEEDDEDFEEEIMRLEKKDEDGNDIDDDNRQTERKTSPMDLEKMEKGQLEQAEKVKEEDKTDRPSLASRMSLRPDEEQALRGNRALSALLEQDTEEQQPLGVEEVFDILPLYGSLEPGDTEQVTFTFFGHADVWGEVKAICEVEGGPTYELMIQGEASLVEYRFDHLEIDFGKVMYDQVAVAELTLLNTGKVAFEYHALNIDPALVARPQPGQPVLVPHTGIIEPFSEQKLQVRFLPGVPERFSKAFAIQVAHFEPDIVTLQGEGVFPRVSLDLPRYVDDSGYYETLLKEARKILMPQASGTMPAVSGVVSLQDAHSGGGGHVVINSYKNIDGHQEHRAVPTDLEVQMEVERLAVRDFAQQQKLTPCSTCLSTDYTTGLEETVPVHMPAPPTAGTTEAAAESRRSRRRKQKPKLPEYLLDFGYVVLGTQRTHVVRATNTGWCPVSFKMDRGSIHTLGFIVELDRVRNLPGAPDNETVDFVVTFDPRAANLQLGPVEAVVPIQIVNGPQVVLRLRAHVTMPDMEISDDVLEFQEVKCGECRVITVQIHNHQHVRCDWFSGHTDDEKKQGFRPRPEMGAHRHMPMHLRRKMRQEKKKPLYFEILPASGSLMPGQRVNIQVKFMPTEEKYYEQRIPIKIAQSSQRILLLCRGQGLEPRLEFERQLVEFGPILPHSSGDEQEVLIRNPCSFPVEFYNLEFDSQYLEEEKVLRLMRGYDEYNTILLPPRNSGDKVPHELQDFYDEQLKKLEEEDRAREEAHQEELRRQQEDPEREEQGEENKTSDDTTDGQATVPGNQGASLTGSTKDLQQDLLPLAPPATVDPEKKDEILEERNATKERMRESVAGSGGVGELEITPVSAAIARHLGIDLSQEGKAARNRRGIAIILHGAPMSGKTTTAVMLARQYEAAILSLDGVVLDAIANGNSAAGLKARHMCAEAARKRAEEQKLMEGEEGEKKVGGLSVEAVTAHTQQGAAAVGAGSQVSNRKISAAPKEKHHGSVMGGKTLNTSSVEGGTGSQVPSSPPPLVAPIARRLSISASVAGEEGLLSCVLPEEVLVEILAERLQLNDCHRGVVFDGLETLFAQNMFTAVNAILKALNNRRFIYFCSLRLDYSILKEQEKKDQEEKEKQAKLAEEQERLRLEEMDEEEYDALSDEEKARVDEKRLIIKKERIKREQEERTERERKEKEVREEEERRREEEMRNRKGKKKQPDAKDAKDKDKKGAPADKKGAAPVSDRGQKPQGGSRHDPDHKGASSTERPESHQTEKSDDDGKDHSRQGWALIRKKKGKDGKKLGKDWDCQSGEEVIKDPIKEAEMVLMQRFRTFEHAHKDISELLESWDRTTLQIRRPPTPSEKSEEEQGKDHPPSGKKGKGKDKHDKEKEKQRQLEREMAEKAAKEAAAAEEPGEGDEADSAMREEDLLGVPHVQVDCSDRSSPAWQKIHEACHLPTVGDVLDGLGMGPHGPPIPPPAVFAVVPFPVKRKAPPISEFGGHYVFIASSPDDPNVVVEEKSKEPEAEEEKSITPDKIGKEESAPTRGKGKGPKQSNTVPTLDPKLERKRSADRKSRQNRRNSMLATPPPGPTTPVSDGDNQSTTGEGLALSEPKTPKLTMFRWVIPAYGETILRLRFQSEELGQFDQTMNFEIVGTRRRYQLFCRGICAFPTISKEPRLVFPSRKKNRKLDEIVHKKYVLMTETFEFGPLLVGKSRERYKEAKYPENMDTFSIHNTSPLEADISFCFLSDSKGDTFLLDPPTACLKPGESTQLTVWAYPKGPGRYEDAVVCCIRENPEPVIFKVACDGFRPELELDKKQLHFDKILIHRKDTKTLYLRNSTQLPVAWRLSGLENLGDDFTVAADSGIVEPLSEYPLQAYFRAMKPVQTSKRMIRLEISDVDNIMGVVNTEPIQVIAEAYDVALDMSFPKGTDGGLDFGTIRVNEERKETCTLKNKGKYEITFNFVVENCDPNNPGVASLFSVIPSKATLGPQDRPTQVQIIFRSSREVVVKDQPIFKCHVIEPNLGEGGEIIANIPVKVSVKAVFSKFNILPASDINFGSLLVNSRKTRVFTIENKGEYEFKYSISKMVKEAAGVLNTRQQRPAIKGEKRDGSSSGRSVARPKKADSVRQDAGMSQSRLVLGMFTIFPAVSMIPPNSQQTITVDCVAEAQGRVDEEMSIDITEREPKSYPGGIPYKLIAEACIPSINIDDIGCVFEEHRICKNLSVWQHTMDDESGGVYGEEEKKFLFNNVIVGRKAKARFKISNTTKVPCDVVFQLKPVTLKGAPKIQEIFDVEPPRAQVANHSYMYVTVTFTPPSMQSYNAIFEAAIEGVSQNQARGKSLSFEVAGEGNLPRVTVARPTVRNKRGQPLLLFKKILLGTTQARPMELLNDSTLPCKVDVDLMDTDGAFMLQPTGSTQDTIGEDNTKDPFYKRPHTASVVINVGETATFNAIYKPSQPQRSQAIIRLSVQDNQYEDSTLQLVGEGYVDDITLDNITSAQQLNITPEDQEGNMAEDDVCAAKPNLMRFGDCYINEGRTLTLTMTNHSKSDCVRFCWPEHPQLRFSPQVGHLHGGCGKDIAVTFLADAPTSMVEEVVPAKVMKITFDKPTDQVSDWDDRIRTVKWVDVGPTPTQTADGSVVKSQPSTPQIPQRPMKKKIVETELEPAYIEVVESARTVDLLVSAVADFCKHTCKTTSIHFRDTLMFQTRLYEVVLRNSGTIAMDYNWQVVMDNFSPSIQRSVTFMSEGERPESRVDMVEASYVPFTVEPPFGSVLPGKRATCTVKFSPLDVNEHEGRLICSIPNLEKDTMGPVIYVRARSLMPFCHFELQDSDYITGARRNPELRGPNGAPPGFTLDPNTRVIEFDVVGMGVHCIKEFNIVNPTNEKYEFEWICEDEIDHRSPPAFKCLNPKGDIRSGRKFKVGFEFVSSKLDIVESFWRFKVPSQDISVPFLLVGNTREPDVIMDRSHFNFKALLIGREAMETVYLINNENMPFNYHFVEDSCHSEGYASHLIVQPISGQIPAKSRLAVNMYFAPTSEKEVNFNLVCKIQRRVMPVMLNVKAEGYTMNCVLLCEDSAGNRVQLSSRGINLINFGDVEVNEQAMRQLFILNSGKYNFDYTWHLSDTATARHEMVKIDKPQGGVMCGETTKCTLSFCPPIRMSLKECELSLKISNGPTYSISIMGQGVTPGLHFSFHSNNFGNVFVYRAGMPLHTITLKLTNKDRKAISVDCLYDPTAHLHHNFEARVIAAGESVDIPFTFYPREARRYQERVTFEINGLSKQTVEFIGTGCDLKIEVADMKHKLVNLGSRFVGEVVKKYVPIVNNSPAAITFQLAFTPSSPKLQPPDVMSIAPAGPITLDPRGGTTKVEIVFKPKSRIPAFTEEVLLECAGLSQPLFVLRGSCLGMQILLDTDAIPFGTVYQRSQTTRKLVMTNSGEMNTRFRWDLNRFLPDFSISPVEGYITPGMEVTFDVNFHPQNVSQDIRYDKLRCFLDGGPHKPVTLTLTGSCTGIPPIKEVQNFFTQVRGRDTKFISIPNRTNQQWELTPVIEGEHWTGPVTFSVEPLQTKQYELTYKPVTMTSENKKHQGTIFFPLPDGTGLLFNLVGTAEHPKPCGKIMRDVPCKTTYSEPLSVVNWLKKTQRFRVRIEPIKPDRLDPGTTVKGMEFIDIPANSKKDYKLNFYAYREGTFFLKVTFANEQTGEYQYYEIQLRSTKPGVIATVDLSTPVRQSVPHTVRLENPLHYPVSFNASCNIPEVLMPTGLQVPAQSQGRFNFEYQPLKVGEVQGKLEFGSQDLGLFTFDLILRATAASPEKAIYLRTSLGQTQVQTARFLNYAKQKTDYACKVDSADFHVDKTVAAAPGSTGGTEVALEVTFEPSKLGEQRGMLTVISPVGGEYVFPLFGTCLPPKPQGPFIVKAGGTTSIVFRNVFSSTTTFTFQVDNPLFNLPKQVETIRTKKDHRIVVGFDGNDSGSKAAVMGRLVVSCARSAGGSASVQWVYYLKGVTL
ncbi:hydrocephalus-inducing protein homolog isoform X4 [Littorina saxatilis]|uniref:hydrocephalus-inducing protein homolog isoform X4 n=1 Tax=Littorina saxatilis TaxID=31220 RepID=UPI0038B5A24D